MSGDSGSTRVLIITDEGVPARAVAAVADDLQTQLGQELGSPVQLTTRTQTVLLRPDNVLDVQDVQEAAREYGTQEYTVLITELPRFSGDRPGMVEAFPDYDIAVISCPTLGAVALRRNLKRTVASAVMRLHSEHSEESQDTVGASSWEEYERDEIRHQVLRPAPGLGTIRTVAGMVRGNEPLSTAPHLSGAFAGACASGGFCLFYTSIWSMASFLPIWRLSAIGAVAVLVMSVWLVFSNGLWDKPNHERWARVVLYYNVSALVTVLVTVFALYVGLIGLMLVATLVVISPEFLAQQVGSASFMEFLSISWLAAAMGVVGGSLGSSFDDDVDLRRLTQGQRERQRIYTE